MQLSKKLSALSALKAQVQKQEAAISSERTKAIKNLHVDFGFTSPDELIAAIKSVSAPVRGKPGPKPKASKTGGGDGVGIKAAAKPAAKTVSKPASKPGKKGKRGKITPELKAKLKELVIAKKTSQEIAKSLLISVASVQTVKKELGLVKARKK